jgi:hypothetical protein
VRRNRRNEARREVTLPWFREEGSQPSQLGGYKIILFDHLSQDFSCNQTLAKILSGPAKIQGTANPGAQEATTLLTVFSLRVSLPSSCLNSAFRIDISGGLRTSLQEKRNDRRATTTADARTDPTSQPKTSEKTPTPAITRQSPRLDLLSRF